MQEILKNEYGGMNEVLYNLAAETGEEKWARAGDRFTKKAFFTPLALRRDELRNLHANTHIPQVIGAARRYEISSDPRFRDVADFFWSTVAGARTYATGGSSNAEAWLTDPGHLSLEWKASTHHQECCCAYNMLKLTRHLYEWKGDPRYFDYYERNLFNHRLGGIQPETGHSIYFLSMAPGAWKTLNTPDKTFWCCTGSALEEYSKLNDSIYYRDAEGIYVNLFIASELDARERGIRLRQDTRFPDEPRTALTVAATPSSAWTMRLRVPQWASHASVKINGRQIEGMAGRGQLSERRARVEERRPGGDGVADATDLRSDAGRSDGAVVLVRSDRTGRRPGGTGTYGIADSGSAGPGNRQGAHGRSHAEGLREKS